MPLLDCYAPRTVDDLRAAIDRDEETIAVSAELLREWAACVLADNAPTPEDALQRASPYIDAAIAESRASLGRVEDTLKAAKGATMNASLGSFPTMPGAPPTPPAPPPPQNAAAWLVPVCRACRKPLHVTSAPAGFSRDVFGFEGEWQPLNGSCSPCDDHPAQHPRWVPVAEIAAPQ